MDFARHLSAMFVRGSAVLEGIPAVNLLVIHSLVVCLLVMHSLVVSPLFEVLGEVLDWMGFWVAIELIWKSLFFRKWGLCHDGRLQFRPRCERI